MRKARSSRPVSGREVGCWNDFQNKRGFQAAYGLYAISQKFCFRNAKSDPTMMILKCCRTGCPWRVYAVRLKDCDVFEIRTYESRHQCTIDERGGYQHQATASVIGMLMRIKFAGGYEVTNIADGEFEVRDKKGGSFHVKLANKTCSCFAFQMLCIPCPHAIAAALQSGVLVETLVMEAYNVSMLRGAYQERIVPVGDYSGFPENDAIFNGWRLSPPATRRPPGRPKKHRFFSRGEKLMKCVRRRIVCSRCKGLNHNKATCKRPI
ncbi:hypothetical protein DY000_02055440 [Brassica cretica]|uniref:SWIM-type domain-containing protein n=1 Tax=Brassica cretica TaxID=69181 RepID=A0ABQ7AKR6_BRACR|nr:hypothetical protein DY000_02055440 [Brassica cretica]